MQGKKTDRLAKSADTLEAALREYGENGGTELQFLAVCKAMEILVEYAWKHMKAVVEEHGLFAPSPREAIRQAATVQLIEEPEKWIEVLTARNDSVHDYFGIPQAHYLKLAHEVLRLCRKMRA